ncbi:DUF2957 domain-containing protein [Trinickia dinghuensis]|uniref:DUF2957 domain-containing protein n=1 Tax=Trinickia dinghuensis TaxID=2291023 RepID=A0A3D8K6N9_9BURK|nr:DUF2957 domain-containing protein [Trinickia dinghuensis]RDV00545.1 DUF2957 domain-containing protein [Trinickia dinghuensis]
MMWRSLLSTALAALILPACGGGSGGGDPPAPVATRLCPQAVDYSTVFTGGAGSGELVQVQLDTTAMTYKITYLASPVPVTKGTVLPTRSSAPNNVVSGTLTQETLLPTEKLNQCAFRLNDASLDPTRPARVFLGEGVLGGTIPGAEIAFAGVAGVGVVPDTTFPYYPFIAFAQTSTNLAEIAGTYSMLGYHKVPSQNFAPVAVDASFTIDADGSFTECDNNGLYAGQCRQSGSNFAARTDSPTFETDRFTGQVAPTQAVNGPQAQGILIVGKLRGQLVPILIRVGAADPSIVSPPGSPPKTPLADDESGIAMLAPQANVAAGSQNGEYDGVDSDFAYRTTALMNGQATMLDPFNASIASLATPLDLDYAQSLPGLVKTAKASAGATPTGKMIFTGGTIGYLDMSDPNAPYFAVSAFVQ